jgi:hypothetical protein
VLLEVVVGIAVLAITGSAWITLLAQTNHSIRELRAREAQVRTASAGLRRITLWPRMELEARVGSSRLSAFTLSVSPIAPSLYTVALADSSTGVVILRTTVYAYDSLHAPEL